MDYQLQELLQKSGQRNTSARQLVFAALKQESALGTDQLRAVLADKTDTSSLYRTLNLFREMGIVQDVVIGGRRMVELTDRFLPHHHHLFCSKCDKTIVLHDESLEKYLTNLASKHKFLHQAHSFEVTGLCQDCQAMPTGT